MSPCPPLFIGTRRRFTACCPHDADSNTDHVQNTFSSSRSQSHSFPSSQFTSNQQPAARPESQNNKPSIDSHRPRQPSAPLPPLPSPLLLSQLASTTTSSRIRLRLPSASAPTTQLPSALCRLRRLSLILSSIRPFTFPTSLIGARSALRLHSAASSCSG